ncbi:MAG: GTP cyclohydrolase II [Pseudomonadota bacterium]
MNLRPTPSDLVARARGDMRLGLPVVVSGEAGGMILLAAETVSPKRLAAMRALGDAPQIALTAWRAETLKARVYDGDLARIALPGEADVGWVHSVADPAQDLERPLKGPFRSIRNGSAELHRVALKLVKSAELLPAAICLEIADPSDLATQQNLTMLNAQAAEEDLAQFHRLSPVSAARLPMAAAGNGRLRVFRPDNGGVEHYAIEIGRTNISTPVLTRLHSACFTGDVLGSLKCDCGPQLRHAMAAMSQSGSGVLLYLNQEGRGIGLANKMRAYALQDQGFDTVEANHRLGFADDERDFRLGAALLRELGVDRIRLMTNNPAKVEMMRASGIDVVERVPLIVGQTEENRAYMATKRAKSGHYL